MRWPTQTSSPCTRRCPQVGFSVAMLMMSCLIIAAIGVWVPNRSSACGGLGIFLDQSAEPVVASEATAA
jgi:hypothetical protein